MTSYLTTLLSTAVIVTLISILTPDGEKSGISKHMGWLSALCIVCILIAPLDGLLETLRSDPDGEITFPWEESPESDKEDLRQELQDSLDQTGCAYFTDMLTQTLEETFAIETGELRCIPHWVREGDKLRPEKITVVLSGSAIWKDAGAIEKFVTSLLGCPCVTAIE